MQVVGHYKLVRSSIQQHFHFHSIELSHSSLAHYRVTRTSTRKTPARPFQWEILISNQAESSQVVAQVMQCDSELVKSCSLEKKTLSHCFSTQDKKTESNHGGRGNRPSVLSPLIYESISIGWRMNGKTAMNAIRSMDGGERSRRWCLPDWEQKKSVNWCSKWKKMGCWCLPRKWFRNRRGWMLGAIEEKATLD